MDRIQYTETKSTEVADLLEKFQPIIRRANRTAAMLAGIMLAVVMQDAELDSQKVLEITKRTSEYIALQIIDTDETVQ